LIIENRPQQFGTGEIRPQRFGHVELSIGDLPQQEITDAHFAGGANEKIGIRLAGGVEPCRDRLLRRFRFILNQAFYCVHQFGATSIVDGEIQSQATIFGSLASDIVQLGSYVFWQFIQPSYGSEANIVAHHQGQLRTQVDTEQPPQRVHFQTRTLPVFH